MCWTIDDSSESGKLRVMDGNGERIIATYDDTPQGRARADALWMALRNNAPDYERDLINAVEASQEWLEAVATLRLMLQSFADVANGSKESSVRNILESKIHQSFTLAADQLFTRGYLDREQRIKLSGIIGELLGSFGESAAVAAVEGITVADEDVRDIANKQAGLHVFTLKEGGPVRWAMVSSCNFRDRDEQIVSEEGLRKAVMIGDITGFRGPLKWWHTKTKGKMINLGTCDFQMLHQGFLIESGTFVSKAVAEAVARVAPLLRVSIGFIHPKTEPDTDGVFRNIAILERSLLPKGAESNPFTSLVLV